MVKFQNQRGAYQIRRGRHTYRGRQPSLETGRPPTDLRVCLPGDKMREASPRKPGPLAHGGRTRDQQPLSQGSGRASPLDLPRPPLHTQRTPAAPGQACLFHAPRFPCPGTTHTLRPPTALGSGHSSALQQLREGASSLRPGIIFGGM